jgi:predicted nucleotidyltransferase component of viral defense system
MAAGSAYYLDQLYPLQDKVLRVITACDTDFYLTGGTALSRVYLQHRFSDDLDLFVNYASVKDVDPRFRLFCDEVLNALVSNADWQTRVALRQPFFVRAFVECDRTTLKLEFVNDVPSHLGTITVHPIFGRVDSIENILANKITAIRDRDEARDLADVWAILKKYGVSLEAAITDARSKAAGTYHAELAQRFLGVGPNDWAAVNWIKAPDQAVYLADLARIGESLLLP